MILAAVFIAILFLAGGTGTLAWVLAALAALAYYVLDVRRNQRVACRVCGGSGIRGSRLKGGKWFRRPFRDCWCCGGKKAHPRLALRVLDPGRYNSIRNEIRRARGKS